MNVEIVIKILFQKENNVVKYALNYTMQYIPLGKSCVSSPKKPGLIYEVSTKGNNHANYVRS